jgi:hypothetical protein
MARRGFAVIFTVLGFVLFVTIAGFTVLYLLFGREPAVPANATLVLRVGGELAEVAPADVVGYLRGVRTPTVRSVVDNLRKAKVDALADATAKLRMASGRAVRVLDSIANNCRATSAARVRAARCILQLGLEAHVIEELELRILALERQGKTDE